MKIPFEFRSHINKRVKIYLLLSIILKNHRVFQ